MTILKSIQTADLIFETKSRPILIMCEDKYDYVCKYHTSTGHATRLFCEYLAASFLKLWGLNIPPFAFVKVNHEHIPIEWNLNKYIFDTTCIGLRYDRAYKDITKVNDETLNGQHRLYPTRLDLIKIGLFDIWVANEDRNHNNYNLLIDIENDRCFVPIDHEAIFNTMDFNNQIYHINEFESLICTTLVIKMFNNQYFNKSVCNALKKYFYLCTEICHSNIDIILNETPADWRIDRDAMSSKIEQLFSENWIKDSFDLFLSFLQINLKK
jgi:hypothetical protein